MTIENSKRNQSILILTKKQAITGWEKFIDDAELTKSYLTKKYSVMNYEAVGSFKKRDTHKITGKKLTRPIKELQLKINPDDYDAIILDEAHVIGKLAKPSQRYLVLKEVVQDKPFIALSGTPIVESPNSIYYQMSTSTKTPFPEESFYDFFRKWGVPTYLKLHGRMVTQYHKAKPELLSYIDKFTVVMSQEDAQIDAKADDVIHYVNPSPGFVQLYNTLLNDKLLKLPEGNLIADTTMKLRTSLHQMESGFVLVDGEPINLNFTEKIEYIKKIWGDTSKVGIMCYYRAEFDALNKAFDHAEIYSSIRHAEGVNLAHLDHFIIFSFGFSGAKFVQLRDRCTNIESEKDNKVHILLTKNSISEQVYAAVSQKKSFNDKMFLKDVKRI